MNEAKSARGGSHDAELGTKMFSCLIVDLGRSAGPIHRPVLLPAQR